MRPQFLDTNWYWTWQNIELNSEKLPGYKLIVQVMQDAMKFELDGKLIRFPVTAKQQQEIADKVGGIFHTTKTSDQRHLQANTKIRPVIQTPPNSGKITALANYIEYSKYVDLAINNKTKGNPGIVSSVGKPWILHNNLTLPDRRWGDNTCFNYGWYDEAAIYKNSIGLKLWQPIIGQNSPQVHNSDHSDPSQVCEFLNRDAILIYPDNKQEVVDLRNIYTSITYWSFISYDGPLKVIRQPGTTEILGQFILPTITV